MEQRFTYLDSGVFLDETGTFYMTFVTEENGRTYLFQKGYAAVPGLTSSGTANYAMEKLEPNQDASQEALDAWAGGGRSSTSSSMRSTPPRSTSPGPTPPL